MKFKSKFTFMTFFAVLLPEIVTLIAFHFIDVYRYGGSNISYLYMKRNVIAAVIIITSIIVVCTISSFFLYKTWIKPVKKINEAMKRVSEGDLDFSLETEGSDEFSTMCNNFEEMRKYLKNSEDIRIHNEIETREIIRNISHDLKTPITSVKGYVEGIMDGVADTPEKIDKYIKTIYNKANDMDRLVNELTIYSSVDANDVIYNYHRIYVNDFFNDCAEELGLELEAKGIKLIYNNTVNNDVRILADSEQLRRVISNIVNNSIKYMDKEESCISILIAETEESISVDIEDNGRGIASEDIDSVFDRFYRTDSSRNSTLGGSGIGLSIVKKIIEDHGGRTWATSSEHEGTTIHFVLNKFREVTGDE